MAKLTFEQRSQAAKKGWKTRRANMLKRGEISAEKKFDYYEELPTGYYLNDEYDNKYEFDYNEIENDDIDEPEEYDNSEDYITQGELIDNRIHSTLEKCVDGSEMAQFIIDLLDELKENLGDEYYHNLVSHENDIDMHLKPYDKDYDIGDMYDSGIYLIDYASGISGYSGAFEAAFKDARRNDSFNSFHRRHPSAKYGKRRKQY